MLTLSSAEIRTAIKLRYFKGSGKDILETQLHKLLAGEYQDSFNCIKQI